MTEPASQPAQGHGPAPTEGGPAEVFLHERASATPTTYRPRLEGDDKPAAGAPRGVTPVTATLRELQTWFAAAVTQGDSVEDGLTAAAAGLGLKGAGDTLRVLTGGPRLSAVARLGVYHHGYRARLVECLADDYPAVAYALGTQGFEALAHAFIAHHPSRSPSLNFYGQPFAAFCRQLGGGGASSLFGDLSPGFVADLADLEWALVECLHAPTADAISAEALATVPPERWTDARLPRSATTRVLRYAHPVNAFFQAFREGREPPEPAPAPSATAVYRKGFVLWRMDLTPAMADLLEGLFGGATLGEALEALEVPDDEAAQQAAQAEVMLWFREWVSSGFFARVDLSP